MIIPGKKYMVLFFYLAALFSLIYSPFTLSVSLIALCVLAFIKWKNERGRLDFFPDVAAWRKLMPPAPNYPIYALILIFALTLFAGWPVQEWDFWLDRLRTRLPLLLLPLAVVIHPPLSTREFNGLLYAFVLMLVFTCIGVGINYATHFEAVHDMIKQGQSIPVPRNHVRFSVLMAIGVVAGIYLIQQKHYWYKPWENRVMIVMTAFLFIFIHILSVRTGLAALYLAMGALLLRYILVNKKYLTGALMMVALVLLPVIAYRTAPSFKAKIDYMRYDWYMFQQGQGGINSDSGRFASLDAGWDIVKKHPWLGIGTANLRKAMREYIHKNYPGFEVHMPPNQFLYVTATTGIVGLLVFLFAFFYPLLYGANYRHIFIAGLYAVLFVTLIIDHPLDSSMGVGTHCVFLLLALKQRSPVAV